MRRLQGYHSSELVWEALGFTQTRLRSRVELRPLADEVKTQRDFVDAARRASAAALDDVRAASAEIEWRDSEVDQAVMSLSRAVLSDVKGRKDPLYQRLFPITPSKGVKPTANDAQELFVRGILETLRAPEYAQYAARGQTLQAAADELKQALDARDELYVKRGQAVAQEQLVAAVARRFYNGLYGRLLVLIENKDLVESFFYRGGALRSGRGGGGGGGSGGGDGSAGGSE